MSVGHICIRKQGIKGNSLHCLISPDLLSVFGTTTNSSDKAFIDISDTF